jgi:hypothetical protein
MQDSGFWMPGFWILCPDKAMAYNFVSAHPEIHTNPYESIQIHTNPIYMQFHISWWLKSFGSKCLV